MVLAPRGMGTMLMMFIVGRLIGRIDSRLIIGAGLLVTATSLYEMSGFTPDVSQWTIVRTGFTQGLGFGLIFVPLSTVTFATLPPEWRTEATGLFSLMRNLGSSIGISIVVSLLASNTQANHAEIAANVTAVQPGPAGTGDQRSLERMDGGGPDRAERRRHRAGADHRLCRRLPPDDVPDPGGPADAPADAPTGSEGRWRACARGRRRLRSGGCRGASTRATTRAFADRRKPVWRGR